MKVELRHVDVMPRELKPGILYVSEEFETAAHLCACGCGTKIRTPLGRMEWRFEDTSDGPTLRPSIGNWQQKCRSHYCITRGQIVWAGAWTHEQVLAGRKAEETRRMAYYEAKYPDRIVLSTRLWRAIKSLLNKLLR